MSDEPNPDAVLDALAGSVAEGTPLYAAALTLRARAEKAGTRLDAVRALVERLRDLAEDALAVEGLLDRGYSPKPENPTHESIREHRDALRPGDMGDDTPPTCRGCGEDGKCVREGATCSECCYCHADLAIGGTDGG